MICCVDKRVVAISEKHMKLVSRFNNLTRDKTV